MFTGKQATSDTIHVFLFFLVIIQQASSTLKQGVPLHLEPRLIVHTQDGCFRGVQAKDGNYSMFLGIPYAHVNPENVFGPAIPYKFKGIFDAVNDSAKCPQIEEFMHTIIGSLECLHLNIYVPNSASIDNPLPVMVHIFGGKFQFGFAGRFLYGPRFIVRHDVIFVTFNYRLGPYGFMCLNHSEVPGNQGLKDQVQALRWIKRNIRSFGGNESKITLSGNSAGAVSVNLHELFLQEQLYNRIILQSGVALHHDVIQDPDPEAPLKLAKQLNYTTNDITDALSYLSKVEPSEIIAANRDADVFLGPCIEKQFDSAYNYITKYPAHVNKVRDVDTLIGFNNDEGYVEVIKIEEDVFTKIDFVSWLLNGIFDFRNESKLSDEIKKIVKYFYYGDAVQGSENRRLDNNFYSDFTFYSPILRTIKNFIESGAENMYFYMFSYTGERGFTKDRYNVTYTQGGAAHADELGYLYDIFYMKKRLRSEDMLIIDRMTELWTNFVKYGNPTPQTSELIPIKWPKVTKDKLTYLEIDTELRLGASVMHQRMSFLELLYKMIGRYQKGMCQRKCIRGRHRVHISLASELKSYF